MIPWIHRTRDDDRPDERNGTDPRPRRAGMLSALAQETLAEMRSLILDRRPVTLAEDGFVSAFRKLLVAVQARAERLGGSVTVESTPGRGTLVLAFVPTA